MRVVRDETASVARGELLRWRDKENIDHTTNPNNIVHTARRDSASGLGESLVLHVQLYLRLPVGLAS